MDWNIGGANELHSQFLQANDVAHAHVQVFNSCSRQANVCCLPPFTFEVERVESRVVFGYTIGEIYVDDEGEGV